MKLGPVVQEEMLLKEKVYGQTQNRRTDGRTHGQMDVRQMMEEVQ